MRKLIRIGWLLTALAVVSCVTINIYFPAEEVRGAADRIVNEVWGERAEGAETPPANPEVEGEPSSFLDWGPSRAYAAQDINVSTPEIRAIRAAMKARTAKLFPYLDGGQVGLTHDGLLKIRSGDGLDLRSRSEVNRLVAEENQVRKQLFAEIARAHNSADRADE
ncbi:MAG: DUF1318 domain-containing protein [Desulfuromonadaceae bacterium]